jgi:O-acetyl-ADP-ribose deacetylase (regulator of RNase III)
MGDTSFDTPYYFVSPANSLGSMNGGIDKAYMGMFNNIQSKVKKSIKDLIPEFNNVTKLGRPYLPIGSAMKIPVEDGDFLISSPTMLMPQPVQNTQNAYWATKAILKVWPKDGTLFIPLMCCGYGRMSSEEAAKQMKKAVDEEIEYVPTDDYYIYQPNLDEQPKFYENTEWINIPHTEIVQKGKDEFVYFEK